MKYFLLSLLIATSVSCYAQPKVNVEINPNIELLTIIQYLGDRGVYPMNSTYLGEVDKYFRPFKREEAVKMIRTIMDKNSGDGAYPLLGAYASSLPAFSIRYPMRNLTDTVRKKAYLEACREFAIKTKFETFFQNEDLKTDVWTKQVYDTIQYYKLTERLEAFMGHERTWNIYLSPLIGWGAYNFILPTGKENQEIFFVVGYTKYNKEDKSAMNQQPNFAGKNSLLDLIWHEGSHSYITPLLKKDTAYFSTYASILTDEMQKGLQPAGRFTWIWDYYLNELIVRAIVAKLTATHFGSEKGMQELDKQKAKGFKHIERVYQLLGQYEQDKDRNIEAFMDAFKQDMTHWTK